MKKFACLISCLFASIVVMHPALLNAQSADNSEPKIFYDQVQPVLKKHCVGCHGIERERGDLNLSSVDGIKAGSSSGPAATPGKPDESLLFTLAAHLESPRMPPGKPKIPQRELDLIRGWIEGGMRERQKSVAITSTKGSTPPKTTANTSLMPSPEKNQIAQLPRRTSITALAVNPKNGQVAVPGSKQVLLFADSSKSPVAAFSYPEGDVFSLQFSRDGEWLLAGGGRGAESGHVVVFEVSSGKRLFQIGNESDVVLACDVNSDRSLIAMGGPGRVVNVYRTAGGELLATLRKHTDWILSIAFSPDDLLLASGDRFGALQVWEARSGNPFMSLRGHTGAVNTIAWGADSARLLSGGQDGTLRIWNLHDGAPLHNWNAEIGGILSANWTKQDLVVAGGRSKQIAVFNDEGQLTRKWTTTDEVVKVASKPGNASIITGDAAGNVVEWNLERGESIAQLELPVAQSTAQVKSVASLRKPRLKESIPLATTSDAERELAETREALSSTEAVIKATEESLLKLKLTADSLRRIMLSQENAAKKAHNPPTTTAQ